MSTRERNDCAPIEPANARKMAAIRKDLDARDLERQARSDSVMSSIFVFAIFVSFVAFLCSRVEASLRGSDHAFVSTPVTPA
jgi:hypothetical protein